MRMETGRNTDTQWMDNIRPGSDESDEEKHNRDEAGYRFWSAGWWGI